MGRLFLFKVPKPVHSKEEKFLKIYGTHFHFEAQIEQMFCIRDYLD